MFRGGLGEDGGEYDAADTTAYTSECTDETDCNAEISLRDVETGCCVAVQGDPTEGKHGEELDCHEPVYVGRGDESSEAEEEGLHEVCECELELDVFDVVD